jgi:hypothetical protein
MEQLRILEDSKINRDEKLQECDEALQELKENIRRFIRTGEKNHQLDDAEKSVGFYRSRLRETMRAEHAFTDIFGSVMGDEGQSCIMIELIENTKHDMVRRLQEHFDAISVISQFCLLSSLSREESEELKLHEAYDRMSRKYDVLDRLVRLLYESPYRTPCQISGSLEIEVDIVENTIKSCKCLFNVREFNDKYVTLSPQGYDYAKYLPARERKYSRKELDRAVVENGIKMLSALQKNEAYKPGVDDADMGRSLFYHYSRTKACLNSRSSFYEDVHEKRVVFGRQTGMDREDEDDGRYRYSKKGTS